MKRKSNRVLIVTHSYYLRDTRPRRHAEALVDAGFEVDVLCARDEGEAAEEDHRGVHIVRLPSRRERGGRGRYLFEYASFIFLAALRVARLHRKNRYRVVWILSIPNTVVFAGIVPRLMGTPVVLDVRDPMPEFFQSKYGLSDKHPLFKALLIEEKLSARFASRLVTVHEPLMKALLRTGVPRRKTAVVMNAPDLTLLQAPDRSQRDPEDRTVLYAGTVAARYGVDIALEAVAQLANEIPRLRLRIVGDGDLVPSLKETARKKGIADRVDFDPPVPLTEIPAIVGAAWVGVQPHRIDPLMKFSTSTKILEWCAMGLPVIASRTDGLTYFFDGDELSWIEPGSVEDLYARLLEIHKDPSSAAERTVRARETAMEKFQWPREARTLVETVRSL